MGRIRTCHIRERRTLSPVRCGYLTLRPLRRSINSFSKDDGLPMAELGEAPVDVAADGPIDPPPDNRHEHAT